MATLGISRDSEFSRLLDENRTLANDLKQCQADKDFVWSLWKKLQVTNPDLTEAVGLVVQREREKAEIKDRKVLEILQMKDEKIEELQAILTSRARELKDSISRKADVQEDMSMLRREVDTLRDRNATLELQLLMEETTPYVTFTQKNQRRRMHNVEHREKNLGSLHKQSIEESEAEKKALQHKVQFLSTDLEKVRSEKADEMALRVQVENKLRVLDREVQQKMMKFEELVKELEEARSLLRRFENQVRKQQEDLDFKHQELETVRNELSELWTTHNQLTEHSSQQADLIRQIQSLQTDTQKMLKNQEDAYSIEASSVQQMYHDLTGRYDQAKKMEAELRQQILHLKKDILDKDDMISDLQSKINRPRSPYRDNSGSFLQDDRVEPVIDLQYKCESLQREVDNLTRQLLDRDRKIDDLQEDAINQTIEFDVARLNRHERTHSTPSRPSREFRSIGLSPMKEPKEEGRRSVTLRSRSVSPRRFELPRHRHQVQKDLDDTRAILKLKVKELNELKKAHSKRLERLKTVQENYKNVKDQLKTLETEYYGSKKRQKKPKRADPKELRQEDSAAVWNELAYFKNENRNLVTERMSLEEEVDSLRVKSSQDAATIHELRVTLDQEREERLYEKKKINRETEDVATRKSEMVLLKSEVQNKNVVIERLERDLGDIRSDRDVLIDEKKMLKSEITDLKKEASQHRMDQADLKRDIHRLKRELEEEKTISKLNAEKAVSPTVKTVIIKPSPKKRKQKQLTNRNGNANKKVGNIAEDEEGWEEMSDASEEEEDSELTGTDTLGRHIVERSALARKVVSSTDTSAEPLPGTVRMRRSVPKTRPAMGRRLVQRPEPPISYIPAGDAQFTQRVYRDAGPSSGAAGVAMQPSPSNVPRRSPAQSAAIRQLKPMKQRVGYLQQQVMTLRDSRAAALKNIEELKETNHQLQSDLNLASQRLKVSKHSIQKLTNDVEKAQQEKTDLEKQMIHKAQESPEPGHSDHDWRVLESRLKSATNELSRQNAAVRQLKQDNDTANDQIRQLQDKLSRTERDNSQKRTLLEDQRTRVKQALESAKSDAETLEALETRTKLMQDNNEKLKVQVDSYKKRLGAVTREKREYEEKFLKLTHEVQRKDKIVIDCQSKKMELESALSEMEKTATQQMKSLARESEDALETAKDKLREIGLTLQAYQRFIRSLSQEIVRRTQQTRTSMKDETLKKAGADNSTASMQKAQDLAKNILNLSQSDLDEIMSADGESTKMDTELETEKRRDKKWLKKVDRTQNSKDDFAMALTDLFIEKMEERNELIAKLWTSKTASQSEIRVDNT